MDSLITKIYKIFGTEPRCRPGCGRTLGEAIAEQDEKHEVCSLDRCKFKKEISDVIRLSELPKLICFSTNKIEVLDNELLTITWELTHVRKCSLKGFGNIPTKGMRQIQLKKSTELILEIEAYNGDIYISDPLEIKVYPSPELTEFLISTNELIKGSSVDISWKSKNIIKSFISINGNESLVKPNEKIELTLYSDTEIELRLIGHLNNEIKNIEKIIVHEPAQILSFLSDKNTVFENDPITFNFEVLHASAIYITGPSIHDRLDVSAKCNISLIPRLQNNKSVIKTCSLEVYDKLNNPLPLQSVDVEVLPQASIISFTSSQEKILIDDEVELSWDVKNYSKISLEIRDELIDLTNLESYKIKPIESIDLKLIVDSLGNLNTIESQIITIQVFHYVELEFIIDKTHIIQTEAVCLKWNTKNADKVFLNDESMILKQSGEMLVYPNEFTTYTIYALNDLDHVNSAIKVNVFPLPIILKFELPILPSLSPHLDNFFIYPNSESYRIKHPSIVPPVYLSMKNKKNFYKYLDDHSTKKADLLHESLIKKNICTHEILNLIKRKLNYE